MRTVLCDEDGLREAAAVLNAGGVAVIPTDTVYGLAAHPAHPEAVERLYAIKGREAAKPIALLAADVASAGAFVGGFPPAAADLTRHWPGALTLVVGGEGLRVPDHAWTRRLLAACGGVLRVTSANLSGRRPATDAPAALEDVGLSADLVVNGGVSPGGVPSTVVRLREDGTCEILRAGAVVLGRMPGTVCGIALATVLALFAGCESAHVGMGIPIPGPVKPSVGVTVDRSGVKGTGGVSAKAGSVPVYMGGTTKPIGSSSADR